MTEYHTGETQLLAPETLWSHAPQRSFVNYLPTYPNKYKNKLGKHIANSSKILLIQAYVLRRYIQNYQFTLLGLTKTIDQLVS
jgi:hypothetical protein